MLLWICDAFGKTSVKGSGNSLGAGLEEECTKELRLAPQILALSSFTPGQKKGIQNMLDKARDQDGEQARRGGGEERARERDGGEPLSGGRTSSQGSPEDSIVNKMSSSQNPRSPFSQDGLEDNTSPKWLVQRVLRQKVTKSMVREAIKLYDLKKTTRHSLPRRCLSSSVYSK